MTNATEHYEANLTVLALNDSAARRSWRAALAIVAVVPTLATAAGAAPLAVGAQAGPITTEDFAFRGYGRWSPARSVALEAGALIVPHGSILDVTPMIHTRDRMFIGVGVGLGYNLIQLPQQSTGAIFHDVLGGGYQMSSSLTLRWDVQHWSNGGRFNPVFGTHQNRGYTTFTFGATYHPGNGG